ncbi:putative RNA-binding protein [Lachnellula hyalina]|uniref:Putative RNA-binding protein n=1 Tax=Lachnellula hyalina TaxID=1316788 RepID=A0A8H8R6M2_9HELO|nr:putative RNA-binding protein [Lachnellula hyalina]TVY29553.1 putative RNA-binding protein [Lachnellula hyalina]
MAETENIEEDDLFADLYADDETAPKAEPIDVKTEVIEPAAPVEPEETSIKHEDHNGDGDQQMYGGGEDVDDEIDFNLGGNGATYDSPAHHEAHGPGIKEDGKMFIGGLNWETTDESLKEYFSQFGEVLECTVMRDGASGRSRGFGFLTFKDARTVNIVMVKEHYLDGKIVNTHTFINSLRQVLSKSSSPMKSSLHSIKIDPKRAIPRDEQERTSKIFVGGVSQEATEQNFKEFFMKFGRVVDATLMMDKDTGRPRGFGFVTFDSEAAVDLCLEQPLEILGKPIEVKKAQPRGNMREEEEARGGARGGRFRKGGMEENQNMNQAPQGGGNQMAPSGMTPQVMAQYWQRMQQYFAVMQQQIAMGRGIKCKPWLCRIRCKEAGEEEEEEEEEAVGRSQSPQSPGMGGMNQQMQQQLMAQMQGMQGMGGGSGSPAGPATGNNYQAGGGSNPGGRIGTPGYNAYEQQMFEQQKYEQQQMRRVQRDTSQYGGGGGGGGYGGGPTSWEGMYDDVPQPNVPSGGRGGFSGGRGGSNRGSAPPPNGPVSAPPANAPTGPKNAGRPGANYRGGGRGGNRGFHPYARG